MPDLTIPKKSAGWTTVRFGDVVKLSKERSSDPLADGHERYIGLEHIDPGELRVRRFGDVADGVTFTNVFHPGQVLFGKRRVYQRKVAVADFSGVCSGDIYVLEPKGDALLPELLPFICQTDAFFDHAVGTSAGSLSPRTNWKSLAEFQLPLPSLEKQAGLFSALSALQAVEDTLRASRDSTDLIVQSLRERLFGVQARSVSLAALCGGGKGIQIGPFGAQLHKSDYLPSGVPVVMPTDIADDRIQMDGVARVSEEKANSLRQHRLIPGDIVLPRRGDFDRRAVIGERERGWLCGTGCLRVRLDNIANSQSVAQSLASHSVLRWLDSRSVGTVMPNLNLKIVGDIPVRALENRQAALAIAAVEQLRLMRRELFDRSSSVNLQKTVILRCEQ